MVVETQLLYPSAEAVSPLGSTAERAGANNENKTIDLEEAIERECRTNVQYVKFRANDNAC